MRILRINDGAQGGKNANPETPEEKIKQLEAQLAKANKTVSDYKNRDAQLAATEEIIAEKMRVGLTREQAIAVIERQKKHDEMLEKNWARRRPEIVSILKSAPSPSDARANISAVYPDASLEEINAARRAMGAESGEAVAG